MTGLAPPAMTKATETSNSSPTSPHTRPVPISSPPPLLLQVYRNRKAQGSSRVATQRLTSSEGPASSWDRGFPLLQISCRHLVQPFPQFSCPLLTSNAPVCLNPSSPARSAPLQGAFCDPSLPTLLYMVPHHILGHLPHPLTKR